MYSGDAGLHDTRFEVEESWGFRGRRYAPALRQGEEMIWRVRDRSGTIVQIQDTQLKIDWPVRRQHVVLRGGFGGREPAEVSSDPQFDRVEQLAEAVERVWQAKTEEDRIDLLQEYVQSDIWQVSRSAVILLGEGQPDALRDLVDRIDVRELPVRSQLAIDEAMMQLHGEQWRDSDQRRRLITTWEILGMDEANIMPILARFAEMGRLNELEASVRFRFLQQVVTGEMRILIKGEPYSREARMRALGLLVS
ncbi:MAG: hypothetical protein EA377_00300 [Phycisphaerales bacterium]|nr:MAG: hypothetical protein EA377_00300 [Phycisphaerales bacterium]